MNIKSVVNNITSVDSQQRKAEKTDSVKTEASHKDKEGNGRQEPGDQAPKRQMTDAELEEVLKRLRNLKGVKDNNLKVELSNDGDRRVALIKDYAGNIVRRLVEKDLWSLLQDDPDIPTGHILKKAV